MAVDVGSAIAYLDIDLTNFTAGLKKAQEEAEKTQKSLTSMEKASNYFNNLGSSLTSVGTSLSTKVTLPVTALGAAIVKTGAEFESSLSNVKALSGSTAEEMELLKAKAEQMGATTSFSASEAADAFGYMALAGWDAAQMVDGIDGIMNLAAASGTDLATTSDIVTDALTAFGLKASDASAFADVLAKTSASANTDVEGLGQAFKYCAPLAGALGYSVEDVSVALGTMANAGIKSSQMGTTLKNILANMASPTDAQAKALKELGLSLTDAEGNMLSLSEVMTNFRTSFAKLDKSQKAAYATTIAGKEAMAGLLAIVEASDEDWNSLTEAIDGASGSAKKMADEQLNNLQGQLTLLKSALSGIAIQLYDILLPYITKVVSKVQELCEWFSGLSKESQTLVVKVAAIAAAIGPVLVLLGKLSSSVGSILGLIAKVQTSTTGLLTVITGLSAPVLSIVAVITGLIATLVYLYNTNEDVRNALNSAWESIKNKIQEAWETIKPALEYLWEAIQNLWSQLEPLLEVIGAATVALLGVIVGVINGIIDALEPIITAVGRTIDMVSDIISAFVALFKGDVEGFKEYLSNAFENFKDIIKLALEAIVKFVNGFFEGIFEVVKSALSMIGINLEGSFSDYLNAVISWFTNLVATITGWFSDIASKIKTFLSSTVQKIMDSSFGKFLTSIKNLLATILRVLKEICTPILDAAKAILNAFWQGAKAIWTLFWNAIKATWEIVKGFLADLATAIFDIGKDILNCLWKGIKSIWETVLQPFITSIIDLIMKAFDIGAAMFDIGANILNSLWDGLKSVWDRLWGWVSGIADKVANVFSNITGTASRASAEADAAAASISASSSTKAAGSHAKGLNYVPYDGYTAQLHEGERVLTKNENESYSGSNGTNIYNFYGTKPLDEKETAKQFKRAQRDVALGLA